MNITTVERPWGSFEQFTHNELSTVKLLYIKKGEELSLQYHNHREEFWKVVVGNPRLVIGEEVFEAHVGDEHIAKTGVKHRISAPTDDVVVLEVATGDFDENDEVKIEDDYNRV